MTSAPTLRCPLSLSDAREIRRLRDDAGHTWRELVTQYWEYKGRPQWMIGAGWVTHVFQEDNGMFHPYTGNQMLGEDLDRLAQAVVDGDGAALAAERDDTSRFAWKGLEENMSDD